MNSQSEEPAPKEIMVYKKIRTDVSILSVGTGASVTTEKCIPRKKNNIKPLLILPPRKDTIPNKDINRLRTKKHQSLPPKLAKYCPGYKLLLNKAEDDRSNSTDTSRTDKEYSVNNLKTMNNKDIDDKYKDEHSQYQNSNESVINKTKEEESLIECLMLMNLPSKVVNDVIGNISSCRKNMIESLKENKKLQSKYR